VPGQRRQRDDRPPADPVIETITQAQGWLLIIIGCLVAIIALGRL